MDWISWFDEWGTRVAVLLGLVATGLAIYSSVIALRARRDAGFREAWSIEHTQQPTGLPDGSTAWVARFINATRDRAEIVNVQSGPTMPIGFDWPHLNPGEAYEARTDRVDGLEIQWRRPGRSRVHTYVHRPWRTPWKQRVREAWDRLRDAPR